jgi:transcriptional regulator with XRE-family HTH domain
MSQLLFGDAIRRARREQGLSQQSLARASGVPQSHLSKIEAGQDVQLSTLRRVAKALGYELRLEAARPRELPAHIVAALRHPPPGSKIAAAAAYGTDLVTLARNAAMDPASRLREAAAASGAISQLRIKR